MDRIIELLVNKEVREFLDLRLKATGEMRIKMMDNIDNMEAIQLYISNICKQCQSSLNEQTNVSRAIILEQKNRVL